MLVAFEGVDGTGKSSSARNIDYTNDPEYNVSKVRYEKIVARGESDIFHPLAFDRIDWISHLVYRLGVLDYEWNDPAVRTVFPMPDTHLVIKVHKKLTVDDELYGKETLQDVNTLYKKLALFLIQHNKRKHYALYKSISLVEVDVSKDYKSRIVKFDSELVKKRHLSSRSGSDENLVKIFTEIQYRENIR